MTISSTTSQTLTPCNGTTTNFVFANKIFSAADLVVTLIDLSGNLYAFIQSGLNTFTNATTGLSYTVFNIDIDAGCFIVFSAAPTNLWQLDMRTAIAELQSTSIKNQSSFLPELHEEFFDRITREIQDLRRLTYTFGIHGQDIETTAWAAFPLPANRKGLTIVFDPVTGLPVAGQPTSSILTQALIGALLYPQTPAELAVGVTPTNFSYPAVPAWVRRYGAVLDGVTNDTAALSAAILVAAQYPLGFDVLINGPMSIQGNVVIPTNINIKFIDTGAFIPSAGITITYNGTVEAPPRAIFQNATAGLGTVAFSTNKQRTFNFEWWGAKGDSVTDDYAAMLACSVQASTAQGTIQLVGNYAFHTAFTLPQNMEMVGYGKSFGVQLTPVGAANINFTGSSLRTALRRCVIESGQCTATQTVLIGNTGAAYNVTLEDVFIHGLTTNVANTIGILLGNAGGGGNAYNCVLNRVSVYGNGGATDTGIFVTSGTLSATLLDCDVEACFQGIQVTGTAQCDIIGVYAERNSGYAIRINARTGAGNVNIKGGTIQNANAGTVCIGLDPNCSDIYIDGVYLVLNGGVGITPNAGGTFTRCNITNVPIGNITDAVRAFNITNAGRYSGTSVFAGAGTNAIAFPANAANATYTISLSPTTAAMVPFYTLKAVGGFSITSAGAGSVDWTVTL